MPNFLTQKQKDNITAEILRQGELRDKYNSGARGIEDLPLKVEHPGIDLALMYAQPGSLLTKAMAPSAIKGMINGLANGEGAQALMYGLVPAPSLNLVRSTNSAKEAIKNANRSINLQKKLNFHESMFPGDFDTLVNNSPELLNMKQELMKVSKNPNSLNNAIANKFKNSYKRSAYPKQLEIQELESELNAINKELPEAVKTYNKKLRDIEKSLGTSNPDFNVEDLAGLGRIQDMEIRRVELLESIYGDNPNLWPKMPKTEPLEVYKNENLWNNVFEQYLPFKNGGVISAKSGIHIKKANRGKFTDYCGGKVTSECIARGKRSPNPAIRKRATFAANSRSWSKNKHMFGGILNIPKKKIWE